MADGAPVKYGSASNAVTTSVAGSATAVTGLNPNPARTGVLIVNDSTATLYVGYGGTVVAAPTPPAAGYAAKIPSQGYWEMPKPIWTGQLEFIWSAANGFASVVELT